MFLSLRCEYAVRTALYLAATGRTDYVTVREISGALGIPHHFLAKTVQALTSSGVLVSMPGPTAASPSAVQRTRSPLRRSSSS